MSYATYTDTPSFAVTFAFDQYDLSLPSLHLEQRRYELRAETDPAPTAGYHWFQSFEVYFHFSNADVSKCSVSELYEQPDKPWTTTYEHTFGSGPTTGTFFRPHNKYGHLYNDL